MASNKERVRDFLTGRLIPYSDDEYIRQDMEHLLVEDKGFPAETIRVGHPFEVEIDGENHQDQLDLLIFEKDRPYMAIKCSRGSLVTREREALAASRLACEIQVPITVVTNGEDAEVLDTLSGRVLGQGIAAIPDAARAEIEINDMSFLPLPEKNLEKEKRILMAYAAFQCPTDC
ncbi:MAG: type I restriction enzyme HsdR N-terminal domain-containing protein [Candidatus Adiutricales bacterium]